MTDDGRPFSAETKRRRRTRAGWGLTPVSFAGTMQHASRTFFHGGGDGGAWTKDEDKSEASVGASHPTPSQSRCNRGFKSFFCGGGDERRRWTAGRSDLELRMGPHTRFHLRIDALGASNASLMAGKRWEWAKASHLRGGLGISPRFSKNWR